MTSQPHDVARDTAEAAARRSGVEIRELTELADLRRVYQLVQEIWRPDPTNPPVTTDLLRALTYAGNYLSGAFEGQEMVGACLGFLAAPPGRALYSHVAGVTPAARRRSVGFALKQHQRAWALDRGLDRVSWTFDPLVRRNAHFNLVKLVALPAEYLRNHYGEMHDGINAGDESDRVVLRWQLDDPRVARAAAGQGSPADAATLRDQGAATGLMAGEDGHPVEGDTGGGVVLVSVPPDIETLRRTDLRAARAWRRAVREILGGLMSEGARVTGFSPEAGYVVERS